MRNLNRFIWAVLLALMLCWIGRAFGDDFTWDDWEYEGLEYTPYYPYYKSDRAWTLQYDYMDGEFEYAPRGSVPRYNPFENEWKMVP